MSALIAVTVGAGSARSAVPRAGGVNAETSMMLDETSRYSQSARRRWAPLRLWATATPQGAVMTLIEVIARAAMMLT